MEQIVTFSLGKEEYGIAIHMVQEIIRMVTITPVPLSHKELEGVINVRGQLIPVFRLRSFLNMPLQEKTFSTRIVVVETLSSRLGFIVDMVSEVIRVEEHQKSDTPEMSTGVSDISYISEIVQFDNRLIIILDIEKLLHGKKSQVLEK